MKNYYSTVDNIILTYSDIIDFDNLESIQVRFERPHEKGFDFAEGTIPHFTFLKSCGFTEDELFQLERYLRNNSSLIWDMARGKEGVPVA